jgi:hypothetical protein
MIRSKPPLEVQAIAATPKKALKFSFRRSSPKGRLITSTPELNPGDPTTTKLVGDDLLRLIITSCLNTK